MAKRQPPQKQKQDEVRLLAGKPSDALNRNALHSGGFSSLIPRQNLTDWRPKAGSNVLTTLRIIRDRDPDAAQAVMNFLLLMGQGYRSHATTGKVDKNGDAIVDQAAQDYLSALDARVGEEYGGGMDAVIDVVNLTLVTQGAMALEIEIAKDLRDVTDFHPTDPAKIQFKREPKTGRLMRGVQAGRNVDGVDRDGFLEFSARQFRYVPLHPDVNDPHGRSPILAGLTAIFFKIELLEDLKAVVHNQGYPRLDVSVVREVVLNAVPQMLKIPGKETELAAFVGNFLAQLQEQYNALNPDDTFIHWDSVNVSNVGGAAGSIDFKSLANILDTQIVAGLKQLPILLGRNEGATTTHATVQWRIYALLIESLQRKTKRLIEWAHGTALQVAGFQSTATVTFASQPTSERLTDAQAMEAEIRSWLASIAAGFVTADEAANALYGHAAVETPTPTPAPTRRPRPTRRLPQTRAIAPDNPARTELEAAFQGTIADQFTQLAADYPAPDVATQVAALTTLDLDAVQEFVTAWFESDAGLAWSQGLADALVGHYGQSFNVAGQQAFDELGISVAFDLKNEAMLQALADFGAQRVTGMNEETIRQLVGQLVTGAEAGESVTALGQRLVSQIEGMTTERAETIAITETAEAYGRASFETYSRNGITQTEWLTAANDVDDVCTGNASASPIAIDANYPSGHRWPPAHPRCRCALAPVVTSFTVPDDPWGGA